MLNPVVAQTYIVTVQASSPSDEATTQATSDTEKYTLEIDTTKENKVSKYCHYLIAAVIIIYISVVKLREHHIVDGILTK